MAPECNQLIGSVSLHYCVSQLIESFVFKPIITKNTSNFQRLANTLGETKGIDYEQYQLGNEDSIYNIWFTFLLLSFVCHLSLIKQAPRVAVILFEYD